MMVCFSLVFACLFLAGCHDAPQAREVRPVVKTMRLHMGTDAEERTYSGVVVARHEVQEAFRVDGRIARRLVDVGDHVRAGQVLASLDEKDLRLSMESAQAERRAAASNRAQALTDERRYATLLSRNAISHSEYDATRLAVDEATGRLERAERTLQLAENRLHYANLICSTDGVITRVSAEAGQVVAAGQSIVSVARDGALEVRVDIPERQIQNLQTMSAEVTLWSNMEAHYRAVLREISPTADPATRTYTVRYSLQGENPLVRLGMTANLRLTGPLGAPTARVPSSAVLDQGNGPGVWIVNPETGRLSFRFVTIERYTERGVHVHGELADGDIVVITGAHKLDQDMEVRLADMSQGVAR
ncbi:MAG: efflux RND transporter periplasmic adaptor subunit [Desulfovibrionaceae bacterium]|nr:efflux RND transporter periplasmic adaptor subunit [Desulfovibrionaceae bacterium]